MPPVYESNPKHREPRQPGRKGALCPRDIGLARAQEMLDESVEEGRRRYAIDNGRPFCARQHDALRNRWHGYPISWSEVPGSVRT